MATRYLVQHPHQTRLALIVDVVGMADSEAIALLRRDMHGKGCANGLVVDEDEVVVLRDTFSSTEESSIREQYRLPTRQLLGDGSPLPQRVEDWLEGIAANWHAVLPKEEWALVLLYDVVPALSGSEIQRTEPDAA